MSGYGRYQKGHRNDKKKFGKQFGPEENKSTSEEIANSAVLQAFIGYRNELDKKHDKYERLVKLSRDITIESKRIIFLLHSNARGSTPTAVLPEAKTRLSNLISTIFFKISEELDGEDPYQFSRAYCAGVQEFIEAYTFYHYLNSGKLYQWEGAQNDLIFKPKVKSTNNEITIEELHGHNDEVEVKEPDKSGASSEIDKNVAVESSVKELKVLLTPIDYVLGVQDLTGELMRHCINSLSTGQVEAMYQACGFVRDIYSGLCLTKVSSKEFYRKLTVLRQSLLKIENACYMVHIRGSEIPKHMLADVVACQDNRIDEDEGFY